MKKYLPYAAGLLFSTIFGFSFMFSKVALEYLTSIQLIAYRFLIAFVVFTLLIIFKVVKVNYKGKNIRILLYTAIFQPVLYFLFETYGLALSQSNEAGMMIALIPIFVTFMGIIFLKEKPTLAQLVFISMSVFGVLYINAMKGFSGANATGMILLLLAVISAAAFNIFSKKSSKHFSTVEVTYSMMITGFVVFNSLAIFEAISNDSLMNYFEPLFNIEVIGPLLYLGTIASIGGFFLVNYSLSKLEAHVSSIFANVATIVSILAGTLILGEAFYGYHLVGSIMIIAGVYGTVRYRKG